MVYTSNVFVIIILCFVFTIIFYALSIYEYKTVSIIEGNTPSSSPSVTGNTPSSSPSVTGNTLVYPIANKVDASKIQSRMNKLDNIIEKLTAMQKDLVNYPNNIIGFTHEYKEPDTPESTTYDISISGEPFNQIINIQVPVGETGIQGIQGEQGEQGDTGEKGEIGDEGNPGICIN
jgi:hypothetical protein